MRQLQYREKSRAWTTMLMPDADGTPRGMEDRILVGPFDRESLIATLFERVKGIKARMGDRMGLLASDEWYLGRIQALDVRSLNAPVSHSSRNARAARSPPPPSGGAERHRSQ